MEHNLQSLLSTVGLAARARKLTFGTELTCEAVGYGKVSLVLLSEEASQNTTDRVKRSCAEFNVRLLTVKIDPGELAHAVGKSKPIMTLGVTDSSMSEAIQHTIAKLPDIKAFLQSNSESEV